MRVQYISHPLESYIADIVSAKDIYKNAGSGFTRRHSAEIEECLACSQRLNNSVSVIGFWEETSSDAKSEVSRLWALGGATASVN